MYHGEYAGHHERAWQAAAIVVHGREHEGVFARSDARGTVSKRIAVCWTVACVWYNEHQS
jgi:hypothetical protein